MPQAVIQGRFAAGRPLFRAVQPGVAQAKPASQGFATEVPNSVLNLGRRGAGQSLPEPVRQKMESALGADFSDVRVHIGSEAAAIGALAFTYGSDIYFSPGLYDPHTTHGQRLLGHELTHVVQQRAGRVRNPFGAGVAVVQDPGLEAEADRLGMMAAAHSGPCRQGCGHGIQRKTALPRATQAKPAPTAGVASHVSAAIARPAPAAASKTAQKKSSGYKLLLGAYMHGQDPGGGALPEDLAGHTFVAVESPKGREAWGFSPADRHYDPHGDLGRLRSGVAGRVHDDSRAFAKPGVRLKSYEISAQDARAAQAKVDEYRRQHLGFSLQQRQCATFALDVARAAHVNAFPGSRVVKPRDLYNHL
jgi:hypothetical protein